MKGVLETLASSTITVAKDITKDSITTFAKAACSRSGDAVKDGAAAALRGASNYSSHHPATVGVLLVGLGVVVAPGFVAAPILGAAGFTANGVTAGSAAAAVQSGIGNVVGGGVFATLQSAAAGGYGVAAVNTAVQAAGAVIASAGGVMGKSK
ncbi:hypothetical protein NLG97_g106 [Lecanicillium saksenae]|uniref:Uncharacterized protein n=1 Tax=Lecanicillium saksenae TaxID=468837 RepID=A0ACC1RA44_9HYPO|nr:hypothetical protein NLG97_g106 [Lecanicillium saksenae]